MKKVLVLLVMTGVAQGSLLGYEFIPQIENSEIPRKCGSWFRDKDTIEACDKMEAGFSEYATLCKNLANKYEYVLLSDSKFSDHSKFCSKPDTKENLQSLNPWNADKTFSPLIDKIIGTEKHEKTMNEGYNVRNLLYSIRDKEGEIRISLKDAITSRNRQ